MMKETNIHSQVTSTIAGDDGEAVAKSEQNAKKKVPEKPNEGLEKPADAGWYVAVVRPCSWWLRAMPAARLTIPSTKHY